MATSHHTKLQARGYIMLQLQARQENDNHQNTFEFHQEGRKIQTLS